MKGTKFSKEEIERFVSSRAEYKHSEETKRKISESHIGQTGLKQENHPNWKGGRPKCEICGVSLASYYAKTCIKHRKHSCLGKHWKLSDETKTKMSLSKKGTTPKNFGIQFKIDGKDNPNWKGGYSKDKEYLTFRSKLYRARRMNAKGTHTNKEWDELKKKYNYMCLCCKRFEPEIILTEDHIVPLFYGGENSIDNIQPLCRSCNARKRIKIIDYRTKDTSLCQ